MNNTNRSDSINDNIDMNRQQMKGPTNVDDILQEIDEARKKNNSDRVEIMSTVSSSDMTEIPDDATVSGIFPKKTNKNKRTLNI
jgi:hypothetical protein